MLPHLASRIFGTPLLVHRAKLDVILSALGPRLGIDSPISADAKDLLAAVPAPRPNMQGAVGIAVIPIHGTLVKRTLGLEAASGLTSYQDIGAMIDAALADASVTGILLDIDSPGGEASGSFELARRVREATVVKPIWAVANDAAFSAAYAIASAASRVYVTQTAGVGSIGVIAMHVDQTARDAQQGYRYTPITAGEQKNDFSPHEKLGPDAHARLQAEVDRLYGLFVNHVAAMRRLDAGAVRATEAGIYFGMDAVTAGLADAIGSLDAVLAEFSSFLVARRARGHAVSSSSRSLATPIASSPSTSMEISTMSHPDATDKPLTDEPAKAPEPESETPVTGEVPTTDAQARHAESGINALAIAELCQLAGHPELTAAFLAEGVSEAQVRKALLASRADSPEIRSTIAPDAAIPQQNQSAANPLMAAVKKLTGKE